MIGPCTQTTAETFADDLCTAFGGKPLSNSDFSDGMMWGFQLVRRVHGNTWHPTTDELRGTSSYGSKPTDPTYKCTGTGKWDYDKVEYFMFSTGDFTEW